MIQLDPYVLFIYLLVGFFTVALTDEPRTGRLAAVVIEFGDAE